MHVSFCPEHPLTPQSLQCKGNPFTQARASPEISAEVHLAPAVCHLIVVARGLHSLDGCSSQPETETMLSLPSKGQISRKQEVINLPYPVHYKDR